MKKSLFILSLLVLLISCKRPDSNTEYQGTFYTVGKFVMGADLSYVNQILDFAGSYRDAGKAEDPYIIFKKYGANVIRFRLFHNPIWTKQIYGADGVQMYNDFNDVKRGISKAKAAGLQACLDFHYSDSWADPSKQVVPDAWKSLNLQNLHDSIYNYTYKTLHKLDAAGLMPDYVQVGNEINPGFVLPLGSRWNGNENNMIYLLNAGIKAVRDAGTSSSVKPKIIIHIAQPENVTDWFTGLAAKGLTDFDIIGFSYYYMYSTSSMEGISTYVSGFRTAFGKDVMIMETTYPWTTGNADNYGNIINVSKLVAGYPATEKGQYDYLHALTQKVIDGGGKGIFAWEPAWITSNMRDSWGKGSAWDCNTFFDFSGNVIKGIRFMSDQYTFPGK
jgi:arabinogalactan endo-1,4-beta-galactosidase